MKLTNNFLLIPNASLDVRKLLRDAGRSPVEISKTISTTGISSIRYAHPKLFTEFVFEGLRLIHKRHSEILVDVDTVIVVSQSYDQRIPSVSSRIQSKFSLRPETFCVDVMDGCSGYVKALSLAAMLKQRGHKKMLIISGDLNSTMTANSDIGTKILFGDGISVSILESDEATLDTKIYNSGDFNNVISCSASNNTMNMNGFEVFRFTRNVVPQLINSYLDEGDQSLSSFDLVALHQASKLVVSTIFASINYKNTLCEDFSCGLIGNLGAGSIGAWLAQASGLEKKGRLKMLAVGFGSGLSWGLGSIVVEIKRNTVIYV
jgi:3-oxoacyl-[acyl-carrier-protein] synthase III